MNASHLIRTVCLCLAVVLQACGGGADPVPPPSTAPAPSSTAPTITASQLLDWAQRQFADLFPAGPVTQQLVDKGIAYSYRFYAGTGNYLGVGDADGVVYGLGPFTGEVLTGYGPMSDFACDVLGSCTRVTPDADGNLGAGGLRAADFAVRAGTSVTFDGLGPTDTVIEVASPTLSSAELCTAPTLPAGAAQAVEINQPLAASPYPVNRFSGPYRSYPAGLYAMSPSSDDCGFVERSSACLAPNEVTAASQVRADGVTDRLCAPTRWLMNPALPARPASDPPQPNPACTPWGILDSTWADPGIQGVFLRLSWNDLQPDGYDRYDWSGLDRALAQAVRHGKNVTLGIRVGGNSIPAWVFSSGHPQLGRAVPLRLRDWGTGPDETPDGNCGLETVHASPADAAFKALFRKALADLATHIRADARRFAMVAGVKVTGLGQHTLENRLPKRCNIALRSSSHGDTGTQGHIVSLETRSLSAPVFEARYLDPANPATGRVRDVSQCVCNPQILAAAGYKPSTVVSFYNEVEATLREGFGHKQLIFMNISDGFPRVGEAGRFEGDHLAPPITRVSLDAAGQAQYTYGTTWPAPATSADIPDGNEITRLLIEAGRRGDFAPGVSGAARQFGVENAALREVGFALQPNAGQKCSQQAPIASSGPFTGGAVFPIAATAVVDNSGLACPNWLAAKEGIAYDKVTGFQVVNNLQSASAIDAALWNLTLNTNGLFFEYYEQDAWLARKQAALTADAAFDPAPAVRNETATPNHASASARGSVGWNQLLLARASAFSADTRHANAYQADPFPTSYTINVAAAPGATRYVFNARACKAWAERGTAVRINRIDIVN